MLNSVTLMGRVCYIKPLKKTDYGMPYLRFKVAMKQFRPEHTKANNKAAFRTTVDVCVFDDTALRCEKVLEKGTVVTIDGFLDNMHWYDHENVLKNDLTVCVNNIQVIKPVQMGDGSLGVMFGAIEVQ